MSDVKAVEKALDLIEKVKPEVVAMAEVIQGKIKVDPATGVGSPLTSALYAELLPEGLTMELAEQFSEHHSILFPAVALAIGNVSTPLMAENKELNKVTFEMPAVGKDKIRVNFDRQRSFPDQQTNGTITKLGQVNIDYVQYGTKNRGEVTKVKNFLTAQALEVLGGK